jgi:hypothetical protein
MALIKWRNSHFAYPVPFDSSMQAAQSAFHSKKWDQLCKNVEGFKKSALKRKSACIHKSQMESNKPEDL